MNFIDKATTQQVLGALLQRPTILSEIDKYSLSLKDFSTTLDKYIFAAINGLYRQGATKIEPIDVANYLSTNPTSQRIFENNNGVEYLQDIIDFSQEDNFPYYYNRLKKFNLLRDLNKQNFPTNEFYEPDLTKDNADEINAAFETLTTQDICDRIKRKLITLETDYAKSDEIRSSVMTDGIDALLEHMNDTIDMGTPFQGRIFNQVLSGAQRQALTIRSGSSGVGKALPNSTLIPTPTGWRRVDEICVGDYLFDAYGKPTKVLNVYPQGKKEVFQVTFKDGRIAHCCDEHLWSYWKSSQKQKAFDTRKFYTKTLREIMNEPLQGTDGQNRILVPMQYAVQYAERHFDLPPYIMGLFLGDGSFRQHESNKALQFSSKNEYLSTIIAQTMGWTVKKGSSHNYTWYFAKNNSPIEKNHKQNIWVEDALVQYPELLNTTSFTKFIPRDYLESSVEQRFDLLNGLLDTDGSVNAKGCVSYYTISPDLRDNVIELCQSLGFKTHVIKDTHKSTNVGYVVFIAGRPEDKVKLFKLPRKKAIIEQWFNNTNRKERNVANAIVKIEDCGYQEEMTCFYVDNEEHLFLTESFIVTHNTRQAVGDACYMAYPIRFNAATQQWEQTGNCEKVLFIITEQTEMQIQKMALAYLADMDENRFKAGHFNESEINRLHKAIEVMKRFEKNFILIKMPNPTIESVKAQVREKCLTNDIGIVFYDYIFIGPSLLNEFKGFNLRNDK